MSEQGERRGKIEREREIQREREKEKERKNTKRKREKDTLDENGIHTGMNGDCCHGYWSRDQKVGG